MTTTNFSTEQAFDMLPHASDIYTNLKVKEYLASHVFKVKEGEDVEVAKKIAGADLMAFVLKNSPNAKDAFFNIVAIFEGKTVDEVKAQSLIKTMTSVKAIMKNKELMDFFTQSV